MSSAHYKSLSDLLNSHYKRIFFYRICGTGMGAAATLLKEAGYHVEGADAKFYPPMGPYLKSTGIKCHELSQVTKEVLQTFDLIVVGNVVPRDSADAKQINECGVDYCSFPAALGALVLSKRNVIGIAGTHGKTTTTYLATQVFENMGLQPGYFIGGVMNERPSSLLGKDYFFIESDEYDSAYFEKFSKFRSYELDHMILTSLEFDHADIFKNEDQILEQFDALMPRLQGHIIASGNFPMIDSLRAKYRDHKWINYGVGGSVGPVITHVNSMGTTFDLTFNDKKVSIKTNLVGEHNIENLSSVILFALAEGIEVAKIQKACVDLKMVKRRQEVRATIGECTLIDDFAHHPRAIASTISAIKTRYPNHKIIALFEPNSATARSNIFEKEFTASLALADEVYMTVLARSTSVAGAEDLNIKAMARELTAKGKPSGVMDSLDEIRELVGRLSKLQSVLLVLSNGTCLGLWESDLVTT